jgi:Uma2 family endonuclease
MATVQGPGEQRLRLASIEWPRYVALGDLLAERHVRLTYDRGELEVMTLSPEHERNKKLLARLVEALTEELEIDIASFGSMTCRREELQRGLEADELYWIAHELAVRGRTTIDLDVDPPPDLAFEIEVSRSALDRMAIYAQLRVAEVWRWDGQRLRVHVLDESGEYQERKSSLAFPFLDLTDIEQQLGLARSMSETQWLRQFRAWVRAQVERGWKKP